MGKHASDLCLLPISSHLTLPSCIPSIHQGHLSIFAWNALPYSWTTDSHPSFTLRRALYHLLEQLLLAISTNIHTSQLLPTHHLGLLSSKPLGTSEICFIYIQQLFIFCPFHWALHRTEDLDHDWPTVGHQLIF